MHNAEKPNPPASVRDTGVGGIVGIVQHSSQKQPPRGRPTERAKRGSSWGGRSKNAYYSETVASFLEFFRPRTGLMQGLRGLCAIGRLLIPLHVQDDTLANVFSRPH